MSHLDEYLARKHAALTAKQAAFTAAPDSALVTLHAAAKVAGNSGIRPVKMGDYTVITDSAPGLAGYGLGITAPEMLLGALASCLAHSYVIQAALLGVPLDALDVEISGQLDFTGVVGLPVTDAPALQNIAYAARIESPAPPEAVQKLHELVERYCPVLNTLRLPMDVRRATP
ncbi:MAG: OsmC family protein [Chloroflexota bacterium]|nr:OsmC family protein [Chloroflexota bacterium]